MDVQAIAAGSFFSLTLKDDGTVVAWAGGDYVQTHVPAGLSNVVAVAGGWAHSLALKADGTVAAWGDPQDVPAGLSNVVAVACGDFHNLALKDDGTVIAWGSNGHGQTNVPVGLSNVVAVAAGGSHCLVLGADGTVAAWGWNFCGQTDVPAGLSNVVAVAGGGSHSLALKADGTVVAWGNCYGQANVPVGLSNVVAVAGGWDHSLALKADGTVVSWQGTAGSPGYVYTNVPVGLTNVIAIAAGYGYSLALINHWPATIVSQPLSQHVFTGRECTLSVVADSSDSPGYQWRINGVDISGATNSELTLPVVTLSDAGTYLVVVSTVSGSTSSTPAILTVTESPPVIITQPANQDFHFGDSFVLQVQADGSGPLQYQWSFSGSPISGATNATLSFSNARDDSRGVYTVTIQNPMGSITSQPLQLVLPIKYDFRDPNGPLIWDFSGWYPSLGARIDQNQDGAIAYTSYAYPSNSVTLYSQLTASPGSFGFSIPLVASYTDYVDQGYWWTWGLSLDLAQDRRSLILLRKYTVMIPVSLYPWLRVFWAPHAVVPGINYFGELESVPLPAGADGHWHLDLDAASEGTRISGTASITLATSNTVPFQVSGTKTTVTKSVMKLKDPSGISSLQIVALGPELALQSMHGTVSGQPVDYDAPAATNTLLLEVLGRGTVTRFTNGQALVIGEEYTLTAKPQPGYLFSNWVVAGLVVADPKLRFTMCPDLAVTANFGTNIFLRAAGVYSGLFYETNGVRRPSAGFFTLTLGSKGSFSGYLLLDGGRHSFSGRFDLSGQAQVLVRRGRKSSLTMTLELDHEGMAIHGGVSEGTWVSELISDRAFTISSDPSAPYEGVYTLSIPGDDSPERLIGDGFARFWIDYYGKIHATGTLADGTHFSRSTRILHNGVWPLYISLYGGNGSILGWINFTNRPVGGLGGDVIWFKPSKNSAKYYPAGFTNQTAAIGSPFLTPQSVKPHGTVTVTNGVVILAGGNLPLAITNTFDLNGTATGTNRIALKWNVISGAVSGAFIHPATGRSIALEGVLLQNQNGARGFFLGTNQSGSFMLQQ